MIRPILCAVSALALMASPVLAADDTAKANMTAETNVETGVTTENVKEELHRAEIKTKEMANNLTAKTERAYDKLKADMITDEAKTASGKTFTIDNRMTASGMIGQPVVNGKNERVGTLEDIIVDGNGKAVLAIVADGGPLSMGDKKAAFDYDLIASRNKDGDVLMPLTEEAIERVASFSYDRDDANDEKTRVIPAGGYSVKELLDADLLDSASKEVGDVENIVFRNGTATQLIVSHDDVQGSKADDLLALDYGSLKMVPEGDDVNYQMSVNQTAQLEAKRKN